MSFISENKLSTFFRLSLNFSKLYLSSSQDHSSHCLSFFIFYDLCFSCALIFNCCVQCSRMTYCLFFSFHPVNTSTHFLPSFMLSIFLSPPCPIHLAHSLSLSLTLSHSLPLALLLDSTLISLFLSFS